MSDQHRASHTVALTLSILALITAATGAEERGGLLDSGLIVDGDWLEERLDESALVTVDFGRDIEDYEAGHVPGAVYLPRSAVMTTVGTVPNMLPHVETVARSLADVGVDDGKTIVVYDEAGGLWASRLFWVLEYLGHEDVRVLDGGWNRWAEEERASSYDPPSVIERGSLTIDVHPERIASYDWIIDHLTDPEFLPVDTRTLAEFTGESVRAARGGRIPEAAHLNWEWTVEDDGLGVFRPTEEIELLLRTAGITHDHKIATYCQAGVRASHIYLVLRALDFPCVRVYDGSWVEWAGAPDAPIETSVAESDTTAADATE